MLFKFSDIFYDWEIWQESLPGIGNAAYDLTFQSCLNIYRRAIGSLLEKDWKNVSNSYSFLSQAATHYLL